MTSDEDDVMSKYSYGWIFSAITAFGLLLFLAMSFALYHRRIIIRRKKEEEYRKFFKNLRPDLDVTDRKIPRARLTVATSHTYCNLQYKAETAHIYNETSRNIYNDHTDSRDEINENKQQILYAKLNRRQNEDFYAKSHPFLCKKCKTPVKLLSQDGNQVNIWGKSDAHSLCTGKPIKDIFPNIQDEEDLRKIKHTGITIRDKSTMDMLQNDRGDILITQNEFTKVNKPTITIKQKQNKQKKKKRGLLSRLSHRKSTADLIEKNIDPSLNYCKPRRCAEPSLLLCNEKMFDPCNEHTVSNKNKPTLNPYDTDVSMPMKRTKDGKRKNVENGYEVDIYKECNYNIPETSCP